MIMMIYKMLMMLIMMMTTTTTMMLVTANIVSNSRRSVNCCSRFSDVVTSWECWVSDLVCLYVGWLMVKECWFSTSVTLENYDIFLFFLVVSVGVCRYAVILLRFLTLRVVVVMRQQWNAFVVSAVWSNIHCKHELCTIVVVVVCYDGMLLLERRTWAWEEFFCFCFFFIVRTY